MAREYSMPDSDKQHIAALTLEQMCRLFYLKKATVSLLDKRHIQVLQFTQFEQGGSLCISACTININGPNINVHHDADTLQKQWKARWEKSKWFKCIFSLYLNHYGTAISYNALSLFTEISLLHLIK